MQSTLSPTLNPVFNPFSTLTLNAHLKPWPSAQIAAALKAEKLILMTDVPGVMRDKDDTATKFLTLDIRRCNELVGEGIIAGGMIPKVRGQPHVRPA